jgi:hypothetical protein
LTCVIFRIALVAAAFLASNCAWAACPEAEITIPRQGELVADSRPRIAWRAVPGITRYRVQLESRIPEGKVLAQLDMIIAATQFVPPANLADERAAVKLLVTADCPDSPSIAISPAWFYIDVAQTCPAPRNLAFTGVDAARVEWARTTGATRYQYEVYALADGRPIARNETTLTSFDLPRASFALLVGVRARCESVVGETAYGFFPASR